MSLRENLDIKLSSGQVFLSQHYFQMMNLGIKGWTGSLSEYCSGYESKDDFYDFRLGQSFLRSVL